MIVPHVLASSSYRPQVGQSSGGRNGYPSRCLPVARIGPSDSRPILGERVTYGFSNGRQWPLLTAPLSNFAFCLRNPQTANERVCSFKLPRKDAEKENLMNVNSNPKSRKREIVEVL